MESKFDLTNDVSRTPRHGRWDGNGNSMWPSTEEPSADKTVFSPYHDYLGLAQLVSRICSKSESETECCGPASAQRHGCSRVTPQAMADEDDILSDFRNNGRDSLWPYAPVDVALVDDTQRGLRPAGRLLTGKPRCTPTWCVFCKNNGESEMVYASHVLKDGDGKITCPILRAYTCPLCGASGDFSHTIKYCPTTKGEIPPAPLKTARTSTGRKRTQTQSSQTTMSELFM
ncbi:nanos homolog 1-like [Acanthaster planci]|uniref:Nanos homolog 1-like n=1 Tax=Acanthaster planci TaxID=133434 RepID=A0A8B7YM34_ACAPL|nr:nanos homolog 1-like [Acanthaster planci]